MRHVLWIRWNKTDREKGLKYQYAVKRVSDPPIAAVVTQAWQSVISVARHISGNYGRLLGSFVWLISIRKSNLDGVEFNERVNIFITTRTIIPSWRNLKRRSSRRILLTVVNSRGTMTCKNSICNSAYEIRAGWLARGWLHTEIFNFHWAPFWCFSSGTYICMSWPWLTYLLHREQRPWWGPWQRRFSREAHFLCWKS